MAKWHATFFSLCACPDGYAQAQAAALSLLVIQFCYFLFWLNTFFLSRAPLDDGGEVSSFRLATGNCQEMGIGTSLLTKVWWRLLIIVINSVVRKTNRFA